MRIHSIKLKKQHPLHDEWELEEFIYSQEKKGAGVWYDSRTGVWHFIWENK